jgi:DNA-binding transcriptional MerR regulator/effector-binding domain-containing protein
VDDGRVLTIGDFSRVTHLSIKTLRHYHEVGLLEPAAVDPSSGYRRYALAQVPVAQVIRRFRDLEMPVERVREVIAAPDLATRNQLIAEHLGTLEKRLAEAQAAVASLKGLLGPEAGPIAVELRVVPATRALGIHATVTRAEVIAWWRGAIGELEAVVDAMALTRTGPTGGMFATELFQHDQGAATVYVPVDDAARPVGRATPITVPAAELAITVHRGSHADIDVTYGALGSYVTSHALSVEGPVREHYVVDGRTDADTAQWRTEIGWPVFGTRPG